MKTLVALGVAAAATKAFAAYLLYAEGKAFLGKAAHASALMFAVAFTTVSFPRRIGFSALIWGSLITSLALSTFNALDSATSCDILSFAGASFVFINVILFKQNDYNYRPLGEYIRQPKPPESLLSKFTFSFMTDMMLRGVHQKITADDLYDLDEEYRGKHLFELFDQNYFPHSAKSDSVIPFFRALIPFFGWQFMVAWAVLCANLVTELIQPKLIQWILEYLASSDGDGYYSSEDYGLWLVFLVFMVAILAPPIKEQYFHRMLVTGVKLRTGLVGAIYKKSLRLSALSRQKFTQGYIQTLQSVDSEVLNLLPRQIFNGFFKANVTLTVVFVLLYQQIGIAFLPGFLIVVMSSPVQVAFTNKSGIQEKRRLEAMDRRIRLMSEVLKSMLFVKFSNLGVPMQKAVERIV
ncbi:hypothetical protein HDU82_008605, partial [Entophlyctis luteolus]